MAYMNRIGNARNPFQGDAKKVLCVCSAGLLRSPTAANVLHKEYGYNTRACGVTTNFALIPLDAVLLHWADEIVFVEQEVYDMAWDDYKDILKDKRNIVLAVPDMYNWGDSELEAIIKKQYDDAVIMEKAHV